MIEDHQIVTVVGHGPSPQGAALGELIDQHQVIRMHDTAWQSREDYGTRKDYIVINGPFGVRDLKAFKIAPRVAFLSYTLRPDFARLHKMHLDRPVKWFDVEWFVNAMKPERHGVVNVVPTRGAAAVLMAGELGFKRIRLLGMDSVVLGRITHYAEGASPRLTPPRNLGMPYNSRHDYAAESSIIQRWAIEKGIELEVLGHPPGTRTIRENRVRFGLREEIRGELRDELAQAPQVVDHTKLKIASEGQQSHIQRTCHGAANLKTR